MTMEIAEINRPRAWIEIESRRPRSVGWYAVQDDSIDGEYYIDAYWEDGSWWKFGRYGGVMNVRQEIHGVLRWRYMDDTARLDILGQAKNAVIPRDSATSLQVAFLRRLWLLHVLSTFRYTRKELGVHLGWPRKSVDQMLDAIGTYGVIIGEHRATKVLCVVSWGPIDRQWLIDNAKDLHEQIGATHEVHGNTTNMDRSVQTSTDTKKTRTPA